MSQINHPLEQFGFISSENDNDDNNDERNADMRWVHSTHNYFPLFVLLLYPDSVISELPAKNPSPFTPNICYGFE